MQENVRQFIKTAKASLLANAKKPVTEPILNIENSPNTIFNHQNYIDLTKIEFEKISISVHQLELARGHLVGALAALEGFEGLAKRDLLISANLTHSYIYMLNEFVRMKQERMAKPIKGLQQLAVQ